MPRTNATDNRTMIRRRILIGGLIRSNSAAPQASKATTQNNTRRAPKVSGPEGIIPKPGKRASQCHQKAT